MHWPDWLDTKTVIAFAIGFLSGLAPLAVFQFQASWRRRRRRLETARLLLRLMEDIVSAFADMDLIVQPWIPETPPTAIEPDLLSLKEQLGFLRAERHRLLDLRDGATERAIEVQLEMSERTHARLETTFFPERAYDPNTPVGVPLSFDPPSFTSEAIEHIRQNDIAPRISEWRMLIRSVQELVGTSAGKSPREIATL